MTNDNPPPAPDAPAASASGLRLPLVCCWLLMLVTFSAPGREGPQGSAGLDLIGLAKLGVRAFVILALAGALARHAGDRRRPAVAWCFAPFAAFLAWALATTAWSPLKAISLGQWGGLLAQVMLAAVVALRWSGPRDTSTLLRHLCFALAGVSAVLTAVDFVSHDLSGLNREESLADAASGLVHPTSAGATGSLGVVILIAARLLWGWGWVRAFLIPGLIACAALLVLSHSRMALAVTGAAVGLAFLRYTGTQLLAGAVVAATGLGAIFLAVDPGLSEVDRGRKDLSAYWRRGETDEQMSSLNGRGDLWEAVWVEVGHAPLVGHGYFLTARTGLLDVWSGPAVRTAHNVLLQVLVSTGLVGLGLFVWAMVRPLRAAARELRGGGEAGKLGAFLLLLGVWYLGWGQLCESFMGPVQPESVVFYCLFGLAVAQVRRAPVGADGAEAGR